MLCGFYELYDVRLRINASRYDEFSGGSYAES